MRRNSGLVSGAAKHSTLSSTSGEYDTFDQHNYRLDNIWPRNAGANIRTSTRASTFNEGDTITFEVSADTLTSTTLYYSIEGVTGTINTSDFTSGSLTGSFSTNSSGYASFTVTLTLDGTSESGDSFLVRVRSGSTSGTIIGTSDVITITNPSFTTSLSATTINEGDSITVTVNTTNITNNKQLYVYLSGTNITYAFSTYGQYMTINNNTGSLTFTSNANWYTDSSRTITVYIRDYNNSYTLATTSFTLNDSSTSPTISNNYSQINEGSSVTFTTTSLSGATTSTPFYWYVDGAITAQSTNGTVYPSSNNGSLSFTVYTTSNNTINDTASFRIYITNQWGQVIAYSNYVQVNDVTPYLDQYSIQYTPNPVNEGSTVSVSGTVSNLPNTTVYVFLIDSTSGVEPAYSGAQQVSTNWQGSFNASFTITADNSTEGTQTVYTQVTYNGNPLPNNTSPATLTINDTSTTPQQSATGSFNITTATITSQSLASRDVGMAWNYNDPTTFVWTNYGGISSIVYQNPNWDSNVYSADGSSNAHSSTGALYQNLVWVYSSDGSKLITYNRSNSYLSIYSASGYQSVVNVINGSPSSSTQVNFNTADYGKVSDLACNTAGTRIFISWKDYNGNGGATVTQLNLSTPWNLYTVSSSTEVLRPQNNLSSGNPYYIWSVRGQMAWKSDGTEVTWFSYDAAGAEKAMLLTFTVPTAWDLSSINTQTPVRTKDFSTLLPGGVNYTCGHEFNFNGDELFIGYIRLDNSQFSIAKFTLTSGSSGGGTNSNAFSLSAAPTAPTLQWSSPVYDMGTGGGQYYKNSSEYLQFNDSSGWLSSLGPLTPQSPSPSTNSEAYHGYGFTFFNFSKNGMYAIAGSGSGLYLFKFSTAFSYNTVTAYNYFPDWQYSFYAMNGHIANDGSAAMISQSGGYNTASFKSLIINSAAMSVQNWANGLYTLSPMNNFSNDSRMYQFDMNDTGTKMIYWGSLASPKKLGEMTFSTPWTANSMSGPFGSGSKNMDEYSSMTSWDDMYGTNNYRKGSVFWNHDGTKLYTNYWTGNNNYSISSHDIPSSSGGGGGGSSSTTSYSFTVNNFNTSGGNPFIELNFTNSSQATAFATQMNSFISGGYINTWFIQAPPVAFFIASNVYQVTPTGSTTVMLNCTFMSDNSGMSISQSQIFMSINSNGGYPWTISNIITNPSSLNFMTGDINVANTLGAAFATHKPYSVYAAPAYATGWVYSPITSVSTSGQVITMNGTATSTGGSGPPYDMINITLGYTTGGTSGGGGGGGGGLPPNPPYYTSTPGQMPGWEGGFDVNFGGSYTNNSTTPGSLNGCMQVVILFATGFEAQASLFGTLTGMNLVLGNQIDGTMYIAPISSAQSLNPGGPPGAAFYQFFTLSGSGLQAVGSASGVTTAYNYADRF